MDMSVMHSCLKQLRACTAIADACAVLAEAVGVQSAASASTVFLLDYTGTGLLPLAEWNGQKGTRLHSRDAVLPLHAEDPLGFALQSGKPYHVRNVAKNKPFASLAFLPSCAGDSTQGQVLALSLNGLENICIGGLLLGLHRDRRVCHAETEFLCNLGALVLHTHLHRTKTREELRGLHEALARLENNGAARSSVAEIFVGAGGATQRIRDNIAKAAKADFPVLITGETGTGKELAAQALHTASPRCNAPFVCINCGALPPHLIESELFGHRKGAFTGADADHQGLLRSAHGGTVLLDEIGDMPLPLQVKLLRVLQDHEVRPVGELRTYFVNVRIIAATNRDMREVLGTGAFRQDLYYRLAALRIHLPPLRQRRDDIPVLAAHFLEEARAKAGRPRLRLAPESLRMLYAEPFPGNVRQLRDMIRCAVFMTDVSTLWLTPEMLRQGEDDGLIATHGTSFTTAVQCFEVALIKATLARHAGNVADAAKELDLPRSTLASKLKKMQHSAGI